jgi:uncharacterized phage-associated protein
MAASIMQVARTLGQVANWSLSNLEMQKISYIAEMLHLGRTGAPLIREDWQAWDYGPVQPDLYHKAKVYGTAPVRDIFMAPSLSAGTSEHKAIVDAYDAMKSMNPGRMVAVTHRPGGAWATNYRAGRKGVTIPKYQIRAEYGTLITE